MTVILHQNHNKLLFNILNRQFCSQSKQHKPLNGEKYLSPLNGTDYNITNLMKSSHKKSNDSKISSKLRNKYEIKLPIHGAPKQRKTESMDVLEGKSKLLHRFNQESDIYIGGNTQFVNRKYEPLIEQINNIKTSLDSSIHRTTDKMEYDLNKMDGSDDFDELGKPSDKMDKFPMKLHEQWNYFFRGDESESLYNESETWNVIGHINKRYSYGKSLRYSDRFYRNWAIQLAYQQDKTFQESRTEYASSPSRWR